MVKYRTYVDLDLQITQAELDCLSEDQIRKDWHIPESGNITNRHKVCYLFDQQVKNPFREITRIERIDD